MFKDIDRIIVENIKTGEVLAMITDDEITTASDDIVVRMRPVYDEPERVVIKVKCAGVDAAQAKVDELAEKIAEAKTLVNELASALDELRFTFSMDDGSGA